MGITLDLEEQTKEWSKKLDGTDSEKLKAIGEILLTNLLLQYDISENIILIRDMLYKKIKK